ncbi:MAG: hypothetical protein ACLTQK_24280 [Escherichia coli]
MNKKKTKVVISGVNIVEGGALTTFQSIIGAFSKFEDISLVCLVNSKKTFW